MGTERHAGSLLSRSRGERFKPHPRPVGESVPPHTGSAGVLAGVLLSRPHWERPRPRRRVDPYPRGKPPGLSVRSRPLPVSRFPLSRFPLFSPAFRFSLFGPPFRLSVPVSAFRFLAFRFSVQLFTLLFQFPLSAFSLSAFQSQPSTPKQLMSARSVASLDSQAKNHLNPASQQSGAPFPPSPLNGERAGVRGENDPNSPSQQPGPPQPPTGAARALAALPNAALVAQAKLGNAEALEILLRRHWRRFCRYAQRLCGDPDAAQDVCQAACFQAVMHLSNLRADGAFCVWVEGLIANEARRSKEKLKIVGTPIEEFDLYLIEDMSVEPPIHAAEDLKCLQAVLWQEATVLPGPSRQAAVFMLEYYGREQELPPVRTIAQATHTSQGTAERCRRFILHRWRRVLAAFGFHP